MTVLVKSKALLYSTCDYCGFTTSNTSADKVWAAETDHRDTCNAKKPASASGVQSKRPARSG